MKINIIYIIINNWPAAFHKENKATNITGMFKVIIKGLYGSACLERLLVIPSRFWEKSLRGAKFIQCVCNVIVHFVIGLELEFLVVLAFTLLSRISQIHDGILESLCGGYFHPEGSHWCERPLHVIFRHVLVATMTGSSNWTTFRQLFLLFVMNLVRSNLKDKTICWYLNEQFAEWFRIKRKWCWVLLQFLVNHKHKHETKGRVWYAYTYANTASFSENQGKGQVCTRNNISNLIFH